MLQTTVVKYSSIDATDNSSQILFILSILYRCNDESIDIIILCKFITCLCKYPTKLIIWTYIWSFGKIQGHSKLFKDISKFSQNSRTRNIFQGHFNDFKDVWQPCKKRGASMERCKAGTNEDEVPTAYHYLMKIQW